MERIMKTISVLTGKQISEETEILPLIRETGKGAGDLFDHVYEETGIRIKNVSLPRTIGEIEI